MKKFWDWIRRPHGWLLVIFYVLTAAVITGAILLCVFGWETDLEILAYFLFSLSALMLAYAVYTFVYFVPKIRKATIRFLHKFLFTRRLLEQYGFRTVVFSVVSLALSIANATINFVISILARSIWFGALTGYYVLLAAMRGGIIVYYGKKRKNKDAKSERELKVKEIKSYRTCGILLVCLPICLSSAIVQMVVANRAFEHAGLAIYAAAAYTFYKIIMAIYNFFKARKNDEMTVRAIRNINVADALVSVLALQTAMLREFGGAINAGLFNAVTGGIVGLLTVILGVFMIANGTSKLNKLPATETIDTTVSENEE